MKLTALLDEMKNIGRKNRENTEKELLRSIEKNVFGHGTTFIGPYGENRAFYCDYTASGRPLKFIEDFIAKHVYPIYANTHTDTGIMARQTSKLREEARRIIKKSVNASDDYVVIFTGSGTTAAIHKLVHCMQLKERSNLVILVGPHEHHSNILPWKECGAKVIRIPEDKRGLVDMKVLEHTLKQYQATGGHFVIGCFSAASNVTGILSDTYAISSMLHRYGALAFWDYATAGPYVDIFVTPRFVVPGVDPSQDAVYLSPHKFVGGVGTPGVLVARKRLFTNPVPGLAGGGTVTYVTRESHVYLDDIEEREEGGTPAIVESIRAGLTFHVKDLIGTGLIERREHQLAILTLKKWKSNPNIIILGSSHVQRLPVFSFMILHPNSGKVLHQNLVAVLLNDLYGIQARSGCACAGPYAQDILGIDETLARRFTDYLVVPGKPNSDHDDDTIPEDCQHHQGKQICNICETKSKVSKGDDKHSERRNVPIQIMKPGFCRLNLPYFFGDEVIDYILEAVENLASHGWKLLPQFYTNNRTGEWIHLSSTKATSETSQQDSISKCRFMNGTFITPNRPFTESTPTTSSDLKRYMQRAMDIFDKSRRDAMNMKILSDDEFLDEVGDPDLIWYLQPHEALWHLQNPEVSEAQMNRIDKLLPRTKSGKIDPRDRANMLPFTPKRYATVTEGKSRKERTTITTLKQLVKAENPEMEFSQSHSNAIVV